jgi:TonB family protein
MNENRSFHVALLFSILVHSVFFTGVPRMPFLPSRKATEQLKITYYKIKKEPKKEAVSKKSPPILEKLPEIKKEEILKKPKAPAKAKVQTGPSSRRVIAIKKQKEKRFETVVKEEQDEVKRATYISYYRAVREKIRQHADRNYPKRRSLEEGEVHLFFVVSSSGELLQVAVLDKKSVPDSLLRSIAINSVKDASPFPIFPKGMRQYQLTFNVVISFELNR